MLPIIGFALAWSCVVLSVIRPVAAQDDPESDLVIDGSRAKVTVVASNVIRPGAAPAGSRPYWPYVCHWDVPFANSEVIIAPTTNPVAGQRYWLRCVPDPESDREPIGLFVVYDPADPVPGVDAITSLEIRDFIRDQGLVEPAPPEVGISPGALQITGVETWLWPDGSLERVRASAHAGGLTVTVEARFVHTAFDLDEEGIEPVICDRQIPWRQGLEHTPCSHTYLPEAADRTITGSSQWDFVWWDDAAQPVPVYWESAILDAQFDVEVIDLEAVISGRG